MAIDLIVNNQPKRLEAAADMPLLWALRDIAGLTGTKYGCGAGQCGACTVLVDGAAVRACQTSLGDVAGKRVTTIEANGERILDAVRTAWRALDVAQCGYCQPGQIISAVALLRDNTKPDDAAIDAAMSGTLCRCGTYPRIRAAIHYAARSLGA